MAEPAPRAQKPIIGGSQSGSAEEEKSEEEERQKQEEIEASAPGTEGESEVLEKRRAGLEAEPEAVEEERTGLYWDRGPHYSAYDGKLRLIFGSRLHLDWAFFDVDKDIDDAFGESDDDIEARRQFIEFGGVLNRRVEFMAQFNFADEFDVRDLYVGFLRLPLASSMRVGHIREPFGLEMMTSSNDITFMERSLTTPFTPNRNLGFLLHRRFTQARRIYSAVGIFEDTKQNPDFSEMESALGEGNWILTARVTGLAYTNEDRSQFLHLGLAASFRNPPDDVRRFRERPESGLAERFVDTGDFNVEKELRLGSEAAWVMGPLSLQGEFILNANGESDHIDFQHRLFPAFYVMTSYVLTGEQRRYREQVGAFGRVHPDNPFPLEGWGAWEVAARYSYLDLDSRDVQGGVLHDWTLGVNWYLNHYFRAMFNYVLTHPEGLDLGHIWQFQWQVNF